jgi:hypothetical protein
MMPTNEVLTEELSHIRNDARVLGHVLQGLVARIDHLCSQVKRENGGDPRPPDLTWPETPLAAAIDALRTTREDFRAFLREWLEHHPPPDDDTPPWSTRG